MLETLLRGYLVYLSFVQPVIYGAQLCHSPSPDPQQVTNVTLTLIFAWLLEVADVLFLSSFIAMRWLYLAARVVLALYFAHPRFLGATQVYRKLFATLIDTYSPAIDAIVVRHVATIGESGIMQYGAYLTAGLMRGMAAVAGIASTLLEASATTTVPAAALPRRMSQARDDRLVTAVVEAQEVELNAAPSPPARAAAPAAFTPSPPPARPRPQGVQPPSLFSDADSSSGASPVIAHGYDDGRGGFQHPRHSWSDAEDSSEPEVGLGVPHRQYREPETMVNRARFRAYNTNPFDE